MVQLMLSAVVIDSARSFLVTRVLLYDKAAINLANDVDGRNCRRSRLASTTPALFV